MLILTQNLDQWTLRQSWLELQLMIKQCMKEPVSICLQPFLSKYLMQKSMLNFNVVHEQTYHECASLLMFYCRVLGLWLK